MKRWIDRLLEDGADNAAFVVHGGTIMAVLSELAEDKHEFYHWQVENGGGLRISTSSTTGRWKMAADMWLKCQERNGETAGKS